MRPSINLIPQEFRSHLKKSIIFHALVLFIFGVKFVVFYDVSDLDQKKAIQVDMVALPNKKDNKKISKKKKTQTVKNLKKKPKNSKAKNSKAKKRKLSKKKPPREATALQSLKELEAFKKLEEDIKSQEIKGNRLAAGDSINSLNKIQYVNYKKTLHKAIKKKWNLPTWMEDGELYAEALIKIDETGFIITKSLILSSGNSIYDKFVLQAISDSSPLPAPPDKFVNIVGVKGVVLRFP